MRYIMTPNDTIPLTRFDGTPFYKEGTKEQATMTFEAFMHGRLRDPKFGASMDAVHAAATIAHAMREATDDDKPYFVIDEADWNILVDAVKNPSQGTTYSPEVAACVIPFFDVIANASKERPDKPKKRAKKNGEPEPEAPME